MSGWRSRGAARGRVGLRQEVSILLPVAFLLVVVLSVFTLVSYRNGVALTIDERREEALSLARRLATGAAEAAAAGEPVAGVDLRALAPTARGAALLGDRGTVLARTGDLPDAGLLPTTATGGEPTGPGSAAGPDATTGDVVVAVVPVPGNHSPDVGGARWARVDLGAPTLALQRRGLRILTWVVLGIDTALLVLVLLFLGRLLRPFERLLERASTAGDPPSGAEEEIAFLVETFERALDALARPPSAEQDELAVLQRTLGGSFDSGVLLLDAEGRVLAINPPGAELLEIERVDTRAEASGSTTEDRPGAPRPLTEVLRDHPALAAVLSEAVLEEHGVHRREIDTTTASGRTLALGLTVHPLRPGDGGARGFLALFVDLTEIRKQSERTRLAESLRQIGELAAGVAHEMRNGLATLTGYLSLIERERRGAVEPAPESSIGSYLDEMRREADHLQRVVEDFLSFARPGTVRLEELDLWRVLERAAADPVLAESEIDLSAGDAGVDGAPPKLRLSGDPQLLERAFRNLLHNAAQAARRGGSAPRIEITATTTTEGLEVTVADRGPGVPEAIRERLFEPFASGRADGVGLGLALSRRIVVLHGGRLELEDRPGGGTVARVSLPSGTIVT